MKKFIHSTYKMQVVASSVLIALANTASAQDALSKNDASDDVEVIQVKGIRSSLENAAARKRDSAQFIDAIVAEDIGKLPDNNVAESLQRVSGVQIRRTAGEGSSVSIRGIRENRVEINGRTLVSPYGRGIDNSSGGGGNQDVLRFLPAEVISALEVSKQLSANQIDGSLGGTINVETRRPLANPGFHASIGVDALYDDLGEDTTGKASFMVSNTFADDSFGVQLSGITGSRNTTEDKFWNFGRWVPIADTDPNGDGIPAFRMGDLRYQTAQDERDDMALNLLAEYAVSDASKVYFEVFYTDSDNQNSRDWLSVPTSGNLDAYNGTAVFSANDSLVAGTLNSVVQGNAVHAKFQSESIQYALGGEFWLSDNLGMNAEVSYSKAELTEDQQFMRAQTTDTYEASFDFRDGDFASLSLPSDVNFQDPSLYVYTVGFDRIWFFKSEETAAKIDFDYRLDHDFFESVEFGARWSDVTSSRDFLNNVPGPGINAADSSVASLALPVNRGGILGDADGISFPSQFLVPDTSGGRGFCDLYVPGCEGPQRSPAGFYEVDDTIMSAYVKVNFFAEIGDMPLSGNFGLRYSDTETTVNNTATLSTDDGSQLIPQSIESNYSDVLPNVVAKLEVSDGLFVRFGYSEVVARPNTRDLAIALEVDDKEQSASAGNPNLEPFRANQIDFSLEWYGEDQQSASVGVFFKDVDSFIITASESEILPGFGSEPFLVQRQFNGEGGDVQGIELSYQQPFTFLPEPFDGFGMLVNYSYTDSSTPLVNSRTGKELPLPGLSENNVNIVTYFENDKISARLAYNWRDEFVDSIGSGAAAAFIDAFASFDASFRYNITEDLSVDLEAVNLFNSAEERYVGTEDARWQWAVTGTRYTVGVRYNF
ncbi:TonB-dependent receptor [Paraglaciecola arctica]|uniref:TonB-dependent receptor n=1 Tax=Paraglaciecola arctica TaxID=1128911 RepID=UPI001C06FE18|nr:TonB-dependent receptor [Paraglaciecola arctica]MBU3005571.1 TonB-dependent receptor [Paraglaciecola arctica]